MKEITVTAIIQNIQTVSDFVDEQLDALNCPMKARMQLNIAIDELFGNIAHYAYQPGTGPATIRVEVLEDPLSVILTFIDHGIAFNPLQSTDPDTSLSADDRDIGGLGIYMVKKSMDEITYEYKEGQNILRIRKEM